MKKYLVAAIIGLAATKSVFAQGRILLDTFTSPPPSSLITYGTGEYGNYTDTGIPVPSTAGYTVGVYYTQFQFPPGLFTLATGPGSTALIQPGTTGAGLFLPGDGQDFTIPGVSSGPVYLMVVIYNGVDFANSSVRSWSGIFTLTPNYSQIGSGTPIGNAMPGFFVVVPEPSTLALMSIGLAGLMLYHRASAKQIERS